MRLRDHSSVLSLEAGRRQGAGRDQRNAAGQAHAEGRPANHRALHQGVSGADGVHHPGTHPMARRTVKLVEYADAEPSAFATMLGGLIEANVLANPSKRRDFDPLTARVGIWGTNIDESAQLAFDEGRLTVHNRPQSPPRIPHQRWSH